MSVSGSILYGSALRMLHGGIQVDGAPAELATLLRHRLPAPVDGPAYAHIRFHEILPQDIVANARVSDEGFVIIAEEGIDIYAEHARGWQYAAHALLRRVSSGLLPTLRMSAFPVCPVRGVKLLLPAVEAIDDFKRFIDFLANRRYNTIMLEVGGAMNYTRHPEINEGWTAYCTEMREYPGKTSQIQCAYGWSKNSIHADNGGGGVLEQVTVRELVQYCRARGMDVIPEVPLLSHCDYLLTRHPELAERTDDPYPDTYCPSNPATYTLVFDVLEEVLNVFEPAMVNIGHDEYYAIGLCERCKGRPAPELYAGDICRLYDFLAARGVKTQMWGEKLLAAHFKDGMPLGGAERPGVPATHPAIDLIPRDIEILHWYWGIDQRYEAEYLRRGFAMTFGNCRTAAFPQWSARIRQPGVRGIVISNWGATDAVTLQRNGIIFETALAARLCWNECLGDADYDRLRDDVFQELYHDGYDEVAGSTGGHYLEIIHTTDHQRPYNGFADGHYYRPNDFLLGEYRLRYANGHTSHHPVIYGTNIGYEGVAWGRVDDAGSVSWSSWEERNSKGYAVDNRLLETAGIALPFRDGATTWYATRIPVPTASLPVCEVFFIPVSGFDGQVRLRDIRCG